MVNPSYTVLSAAGVPAVGTVEEARRAAPDRDRAEPAAPGASRALGGPRAPWRADTGRSCGCWPRAGPARGWLPGSRRRRGGRSATTWAGCRCAGRWSHRGGPGLATPRPLPPPGRCV